MKWFKNLKKWQKGSLIGLVIGVILGFFVSPLVSWIPLAPLISYLIRVTHFIPAYFLSFGFLNPTFFLNSYYDYQFYLFLGPIIIFYGGLGAVVGAIQRSGTILEKFLIAFIVILFLILFYFANFMVLLSFSPGEF
jgi:hypothetical protein